MGVTFKWYELAKWIARGHIFLWESTGKNAMMHIESEAQKRRKCYLLSIPIMHDFAVMLACIRLSNTTDIAKRKQQKRK